VAQEREGPRLWTSAPGQRQLLIATLRAILNTALEEGLVAANPAVRLGRHIRNEHWLDERRPDPFTADDTQQILTAAEGAYPEWQVFFLVMARTGLRVGECLALQPDDLDLARGTLWVRRTWTRGRLGSPKGNRSRAVDLTPQTIDALNGWLSVREAGGRRERPRRPRVGLPLGPWDDRWLRWHVWRPLLRRAGLRTRGMHQLRHSYASLLIAAGAHPKYIQAQLGHASIQITMDVYGHLLPGSFARLVNALDTPTGRNPGATTPAAPEDLSQ
jgi:integrase